MDVFLVLSKIKGRLISNLNKGTNPTIIEVLKPVDVFAVNTLCDEIFCVIFTFFIVSAISLTRRRCLTGVTIVDDVVSIFIRLFVCVRNFIVELSNGVLPVGN